MAETGPLSITPEEMFAQAPQGRPSLDPHPQLPPGRERRFRAFLVKFGEESPQELNDIMTTPDKFAPIGGPRVDLVPGEGYAVLIHYWQGGLASEKEIAKWKIDQAAKREAEIKEWRAHQKKYKGRGGIPDENQMQTAAERERMSDEAKAKATTYNDDLESPLDPDIPATPEAPAEPSSGTGA